MGFAIPAFAVDEYGNYESGDQLLSQAQSAPEDRIVLPDATNVVTNGDFETGNLNGWTTFLTANGVLDPAVALFDTDGDSTATQSARFNVGRTPPSLGPLEGGGIFQDVNTPAGTVMIAADIAAHQTHPTFTNGECGVFTLFFDGAEVDSHTFGPCDPLPEILRSQLTATVNGVSAGSHEIKIQMTRDAGADPILTPFQYIDNVQVLVDDVVVGGEFLPIDHTALLLAGAQTNAVWIMSALAVIGSVAFGALYLTSRKN